MKTTPFNLGLIIVSLITLAIGLWRTLPIKFDLSFLKTSGPMIAAFLLTITVAIAVGGKKFAIEGTDNTIAIWARYLLTLLLLFAIMGFSVPIVKHFQPQIVERLQGPLRFVWAFICSVLSPNSTAFGPMVKTLYYTHPELRPTLIYFLGIVPGVSLSIMVFRCMGLDARITMAMYQVNVMNAVTLLPFFWFYEKFLFKPSL